jgi:hypothetical protein
MIFNALRFTTRQSFAVIVIPNIPTEDVAAPAVTARVLEALAAMGFSAKAPETITWANQKYVQVTGNRKGSGEEDLVVVARATLRRKELYLLTTFGRGSEDRAQDDNFMSVMKTFRFLESAPTPPLASASPLFSLYRLGAWSCVGAAAVLVFLFGLMLFLTRRRAYY